MRKDFFIFGGVNSLDYGVLLDGSGTTTAPERDVMTVTIPGRSGDLLVDAGRWKNTTVSYPCTIAREFEGRFAAFKQALLAEGGYKRLEDTLHPDEYRLAYLAGPLEPETIPYNRAGTFALDFGCKPQRFLKSGEDVLTVVSGGKLYNPTGCAALPLIRLTLTGDAKLNVGGVQMSVAGHTGPMWIDCDLQDAYYNNTNLNKYLTAPEFPVLGAGATQVSWSGGIDKCEVVPRVEAVRGKERLKQSRPSSGPAERKGCEGK